MHSKNPWTPAPCTWHIQITVTRRNWIHSCAVQPYSWAAFMDWWWIRPVKGICLHFNKMSHQWPFSFIFAIDRCLLLIWHFPSAISKTASVTWKFCWGVVGGSGVWGGRRCPVGHPNLLRSPARAAAAAWWVRKGKCVSPTPLSNSFSFELCHSHSWGGQKPSSKKQCNRQKGKGKLFSTVITSVDVIFSCMCQQLHNWF